jgi:glycosyltransferase involved in cell wall biosynthesis
MNLAQKYKIKLYLKQQTLEKWQFVLLHFFNMKNITIISSYPKKNSTHGESTVGIASYAKNTLTSIQKTAHEKLSITVLAETLNNEKNYAKDRIFVKRVWKRNSLSIFPNLLKQIYKNKSTDTVVVEFELAMFGEILYLLPFPLFLLALRLFRKKTILVLHQVVKPENLGQYFNLSESVFNFFVLNLMLKIFYKTLLLMPHKIIVFEGELKEILSNYGETKKVTVIPHGVEKIEKGPQKKYARKKLGIKQKEFVILTFGFLAWYKGTDWILQAVEDIKKKKNNDIKLILAGGENPNHSDKKYYAKYVKNLTEKAKNIGVAITGFVPEEEIADYYKASDVIVLPYRTHMSASGPLSLAFTFKKPFLLSNSLKEVLNEEDIKPLLKENKIKPEQIIFKEFDDFSKKIMSLKKSKKLQKKLSSLSKEISLKRSWEEIGKLYYHQFA